MRADVAGTTGDEPAHGLLSPVFDAGQLDADLLQPHDQPLPETVGGDVATAAAGDKGLHVLLQAELAQTRRALVEVLTNDRARLVVDLAVEIEVDLLDD